MAKIVVVAGWATFYCPGCECDHSIPVEEGTNAKPWGYNGNVDAPTFTPSLLRKSTKLTELGERQYDSYLIDNKMPESGELDNVPVVCHTFVTDGKIQYLGDCTHALANQTIDLPDYNEELQS